MYSVVYSWWWYITYRLSCQTVARDCVISGLKCVDSECIRYKVKLVLVFKELKFYNAHNVGAWLKKQQ